MASAKRLDWGADCAPLSGTQTGVGESSATEALKQAWARGGSRFTAAGDWRSLRSTSDTVDAESGREVGWERRWPEGAWVMGDGDGEPTSWTRNVMLVAALGAGAQQGRLMRGVARRHAGSSGQCNSQAGRATESAQHWAQHMGAPMRSSY
jgi:hypothetical protein